MAVAHSAASESHTGAIGSASQAAFSWTHTQTGTPQGVVVFVCTFASTAGLATSASYGGVALTKVQAVAADLAGELGRVDVFFRGSGLGTGDQTITVNRTNNATVMYAAAATVTAGADTVIPAQFAVLLQNDGTLTAQSVTDTSVGVDSLRYAGAYSGLNTPPTAATGSTLLNSIDIGNYGFAMVREDTAGQGARSVGFIGATDDRAAIHLAIRELVPRSLPQTVASFTLTGNDAAFTKASPKEIAAEAGAFTLTGNPADLLHGPDLLAEAGTFALNGNPADTRHNVRLEAGTGAFTLAGQPATLSKAAAAKVITADRGTFTLASNGATLRQNYAITAEVGAFTVAGQPATLRHNPRIEANTGSFALSDGAPALLRGRYLSGGTGTFTETGQPATFRRTWAIQGGTGSFTLTGNPAGLTELGAYEIDPIAGTFTLSGQPATLAQSQSLPIDAGTFGLVGQPATIKVGHAIAGETGKFFLPERNLRQRSEEFNNAYWTKNNSSITANSTTAPDGALTADTLIENTANSTHIVTRNTSFAAGVKYTASVYVKTYLSRDVAIVLGATAAFGGASNTTVVFSPSTNTFLLTVNSPETYGSENVGNGWYRIYVTKTAVATAITSSQIQLRTGTTGTYTGNGISGAYIWGAQLEEGNLTAYDPTGPTSAPLTALTVAHHLVAETGAFSFTGNPATLADTDQIEAGTGAFALAGGAPALKQGYALAGGTGAFAFTGNPATLAKSAAKQLTVVAGVFTLAGQPATLRANAALTGERGQFALTGPSATLARTRQIVGARGQFLLTGNPAALTVTRSLLCGTGALTFTGNPAGLADTDELAVTPGAFLLAGFNATLSKQRRRNVLIF